MKSKPSTSAAVVPHPSFPVVGVGASAGGLEAFTQLLTHLPADTGMAFVLVQHLDPQHESTLTQILARATSMPVREVSDRMRVEPNHVFVIPRNKRLVIQDGILRLQPRGSNRARPRAIDLFFESLAADHGDRAIGVLLSGADDDGMLGLEAIKAEGGITFAQDNTAKYPAMPRSAVQAGCVDYESTVEAMARELARIAVHPLVSGNVPPSHAERDRAAATAHENDAGPLPSGGKGDASVGAARAHAESRADPRAPAQAEDEGFRKILHLVRNHAGVDFLLYKSSTIQRRISRRVVLNRIRDLSAYAEFLRDNKPELNALYSDMLISVTSFFRNPEAFDLIQRKVFAPLIAQKSDAPVRIWVMGCSTGQEAYSLAMSYLEVAEAHAHPRPLQIFATDLNDALLDKARAGLYAKSLAEDIAPQRLQRFFVEESGGYRASKELRQHVVFARQNILSDPPFSHMDLISCRNLLIYIEPELQKRILPMFHYALNPEGVLFLGASESVAGFPELFAPLDKKQKIFLKKHTPTTSFRLPAHRGHHPAEPKSARPPATAPAAARPEQTAQREADRVAISQFAPPGVLIDDRLQILQFRGPTSAFLEPPTGRASFDILKMAREGLMLPLRSAINRARKEGKPVRKEQVRLAGEGGARLVTIVVTPLKNLQEPCLLIHFEEDSPIPAQRPTARKTTGVRLSPKEESARVKRLENELAELRDFIEATQEQSESTQEELQASNEEVTSANEELQSINEELETSKEELESTNEELTTVNEEMTHRNAELGQLNADLRNLHLSIDTAILVLGRDLAVRQFTPLAERFFNLLPTDRGRPLGVVRHTLKFATPSAETLGKTAEAPPPSLESLVTEVIASGRPRAHDVCDGTGRWFSLRVRPYVTLDNKIDGAVLVLIDVDLLKRSEADARRARDYAESILNTAPVPLLVLRPDLRVNTANAAFYRTFQVAPAQTEGRPLWELGSGQWNIPRLRHMLEDVLPRDSSFDAFEVTHDFPGLGPRTMMLNARRLDAIDADGMIVLGIEDITDRLHLDESVRRNEERFRALITAVAQIVWTANAEGQIEEDSASWCAFTGQTEEQRRGSGWMAALHPEDRDVMSSRWFECIALQRDYADELRLRHRDGTYHWTSVRAVPIRHTGGAVREWVVSHADISERRSQELALWELNEQRAVELRASQRLQQTSTLLIQGGDNDALYQQILAAGLEIMRADMTSLTMLRPDEDASMHLLAQSGFGADFEQAFARMPRDVNTACAAAWREHRRIVVPDIEACEWMSGTVELEHLRADGVVGVQSTPLTTRDGDLIGVLSTYWRRAHVSEEVDFRLFDVLARQTADLMERKQSEEALRASEQRYRTLFDSIDEGFCIIELLFDSRPDPIDFRFIEVNPSFETQSGLRDVVGKRIRELAPDLEDDWFATYGKVLLTGEPVRILHEARALNRWFDVYAFRLGEREKHRVAVVFTDSTERRRIAVDLEHARDEAVAASRAKDEFLAALSHELRTPLNPAMLIASDARMRTDLTESVRADFELIHNSIALESRLIDDLLDATRISHGKLILHRERCEMNAIVRDAVAVVRDEMLGKRIQLDVSLDIKSPRVMGDPVRLQQVLWNVLRNAAHFTPVEGSIAVTTQTIADDTRVEIRITDNGVGIAAADLERIFETFTQAHAAPEETRRSGGLGLGLAISKRMVELHHGSIHATSPGPGKGSTFVIRLPLDRHLKHDRPTQQTACTETQPESEQAAPTSPRTRVLVVDDHAPTRVTLRRLLERRHYDVHDAGSTAEALLLGKQYAFDILISDIGLPDGTGYGLMECLRAERPQLCGIALSGYGADADIAKSRSAGFIEHLTKPVNVGTLEQALHAAAHTAVRAPRKV